MADADRADASAIWQHDRHVTQCGESDPAVRQKLRCAAIPSRHEREVKGEETRMEVVIITGLSGAGKTKAADWFEDKGYYCIDNMPPALIKNFIELTLSGVRQVTKAAFVVDVRGEEKKKLTREDLMQLFEKAAGQEIENDRMLLG